MTEDLEVPPAVSPEGRERLLRGTALDETTLPGETDLGRPMTEEEKERHREVTASWPAVDVAGDEPGWSIPLGRRVTPTRTSTRSEEPADPATVTQAVAGILLALAALGGWLLSRRGLRLRRPTPEQAAEMAEPLTSIAIRHVDASVFGPDVIDVARIAAATGSYAGDGPLLTPSHMPDVEHQLGEDRHP